MRCKPHSMALIVSTGHDTSNLLNLPVTVTELALEPSRFHGEPCWFYAGPRLRSYTGRKIDVLEDSHLRPIRPDDFDDAEFTTRERPVEVVS